jgi:zinc transport system substrate-binding protein
VENDLVLLHRVAEASGHAFECVLEAIVGERLHPTTVVADEMVMMMLPVGQRHLEACDPIPDLHALDEPELGQRVENAVDARDSDLAARSLHAVEDLLCRTAAPLLSQMVDDGSARAAVPETGTAKSVERVLSPAGGRVTCHPLNDIDSQRGTLGTVLRMGFILILVLLASSGAGCGADEQAGAGASVIAAFYPLAYAAEQIGGPALAVTNLTPPGAEPHDLELSARDVAGIRDADHVFFLGHGFQPSVEEAVGDRSGRTLDLLESVDTVPASGGDVDEGLDPHVWLDPVRFAAIAGAIGEALDRPEAGDALAARAAALDAEYRRGLARCSRREIVSSHAAFSYLAKRYGLEQLPLTGLTPEAEPSPQALERLVQKVQASGATTVFFETLASPELAQTVAREAGVETAVLNPLEGLSEEESDAGADYFSVMRANLKALREALGCR